jgi:T5SS/PEP-CTERM-associated repeat protein
MGNTVSTKELLNAVKRIRIMRTPTRIRHHFAYRPLAVAAAIALLGCASPPARAQLVSSTGDVSPVFVAAPIVDLSGQPIRLGFTLSGTGTLGTLSVTGGGSLTAARISAGSEGQGIGVVIVSGSGSVINLTGGSTFNKLDIGSWGTGTMTVSNGGLVTCSTPLACPVNQIGNGAGSTGTLVVNGGTVSGLGRLEVGAGDLSAGFGTPGAATTATLSVTNGGVLATTGSNAVANNRGLTGLVTGNVTIDGAGSQWSITRDLANGGGQAFLNLAPTASSVANVTISNGGNLTLIGSRSSPATDNSIPGIQLSPGAGGTSTMTVTSGGSVRIGGDSGILIVGGSNSVNSAGASATLNITGGGTVSGIGSNGLTFFVIGRNEATGTVNVSGAGSQLVVAGVGGVNTQGLDGAGGILDVGRNQGFGGGTGTLNVTDGGSVVVSDNGQAASTGGVRLRVGNGAGSTGTVLVSGAGSSIVVSSTGGGTVVPSVRIGDGGGTGQITISNGGSVSVLGGGQRNFIVGQGSGSSGTLNVTTGGQINASWFAVGNEGGSGVATISNATVNLDGFVDFATGNGAALRVGRGVGSTGVLNLQNGAAINIANSLPDSNVILGGTSVAPGGSGRINMSGGSTITFTGAASGAGLLVGNQSGTGTMSMTGNSIVDTGATGTVQVGSSAGSSGNLTIGGGSKVFANTGGIGGGNDINAGGVGSVIVTGAGSQLNLAGDSGFLGVGRNGTGSLTVANQGEVVATIINVGRAAGGVGTMSVNNGVINLSGQQTSGTQSGAGLSIGNLGGTGSVTITNGSLVTITNTGSAGASLNVGGTPLSPLGSGTLTVSDSTINVIAAPGQAVARIGHDGSGTATLTGSTLNLGDGALIIAGQPGSTGTLTLSAGSVVNAGYVGVGATPTGLSPGTYTPQNPGGSGTLVLNNSTVNASTFEIGALGVLTGNNGVLNVVGDVIVGGTISPGESPGRLRINCNLISLDGSKLILEVQSNGSGYDIDQLVIGDDSTFDLSQFQIVFSFLGDTDPTAFAASGGFDLDNFLRAGSFDAEGNSLPASFDSALSTLFAAGDTWEDVVSFDRISAVSTVFDITSLSFDGASGGVGVVAAPIPEPSTWALMLTGFLFIAWRARTPRRSQSASTPQGLVTTCS